VIDRRKFLSALGAATTLALAGVSRRAAAAFEGWVPWTTMVAIDTTGLRYVWPAQRRDARTWVSTIPFSHEASIIGCRTPVGSFRWFVPIRVVNGDSIKFSYKVDVDLPDELPAKIPSG